MSFLQYQFHWAQARLKSSSPASVSGQAAVAPLFRPQLVGIETKTNEQRLAEFKHKLAVGVAA